MKKWTVIVMVLAAILGGGRYIYASGNAWNPTLTSNAPRYYGTAPCNPVAATGTAGGAVSCTIPAQAGITNVLYGGEIDCSPASAVVSGVATITGTAPPINIQFTETTTGGQVWALQYPPITASAANTAIVLSVPVVANGGTCSCDLSCSPVTPTATATSTATATLSPTATISPTSTVTVTATTTVTASATISPTTTVTASPTATISPTATVSPTSTLSPTATTTATAFNTPTSTPTQTTP